MGLGKEMFIKIILMTDAFHVNAFEYALRANKGKIIKYFITFQQIKDLHVIKMEKQKSKKLLIEQSTTSPTALTEKAALFPTNSKQISEPKKAVFRLLHWLFVTNK